MIKLIKFNKKVKIIDPGGDKMFEDEYNWVEEEEEIEMSDSSKIYSKTGTDDLLENDEISAEEEAFMNGWDEADDLKEE